MARFTALFGSKSGRGVRRGSGSEGRSGWDGLVGPPESLDNTVRAEIITELVPERLGPVIFNSFLLELITFRPIPAICPARRAKPENYWKRELIPNKAYPAIKIR